MGLRIQHNIVAMNAQRQLSISDANMSKSLERLSSGYRINRAADDAAGLAISQSMRADIASYQVASRNASEASSLLQVAEGATDQISNMLTRLKELATQAASANVGTNYDKLEEEKDALVAEIDRIAQSAEYAGTALIDGTFGTYSETWATAGEKTLETTNGKTFAFNDDATSATATITFAFSDSPVAISAETFTLAADGTADGVKMTGGTSGEVYDGTVSGSTLTFETIGLTLVGASAISTTNLDADSIVVADAGFTSMSVSSDTPTDGTWTITDDVANSIKITDGTNEQTIGGVVDGAVQTLDFDQLGITLKLGTDYADDDLKGLEFDVASSGSSTFQIGASNEATSRIEIGLESSRSADLGIDSIDLTTQSGARSAMSTIDDAISTLSNVRGNIGAYMNRLGYAAANLSTTIENVQASESVIRDVDMASEMSNFTKNQILMQAGTSMLAQANMSPQLVLTLFQ